MDVDLAIKTVAERLGFKKLKEKQIEAIKAFIRCLCIPANWLWEVAYIWYIAIGFQYP